MRSDSDAEASRPCPRARPLTMSGPVGCLPRVDHNRFAPREVVMQGTIVMLMAMSGLGCHHKHRDVAPVSACYSSCYSSGYDSGCYSSYAPVATTYVVPSCYSACYSSGYSSCYSSCYSGASFSSCYGGSCYGGAATAGAATAVSTMAGGGCSAACSATRSVGMRTSAANSAGLMPLPSTAATRPCTRAPTARASPSSRTVRSSRRLVRLEPGGRLVRLGPVDGSGQSVAAATELDGSPAARHLDAPT